MEDLHAQLTRNRAAQATYAAAIHQLLQALPDEAVIAFGAHMEGETVGIRQKVGVLEGRSEDLLDGINQAIKTITELVAARVNR